MILTKPAVEIIDMDEYPAILKKIEKIGRVCYKSEDRITEDSAEKFIANILKRGHESVIEHETVTVKVTCDRGVTHEIVRHRVASYSQESTRYCNYSKDKFQNQISVIDLSTGFDYNMDDPNEGMHLSVNLILDWGFDNLKNIISKCWRPGLPLRKPDLYCRIL